MFYNFTNKAINYATHNSASNQGYKITDPYFFLSPGLNLINAVLVSNNMFYNFINSSINRDATHNSASNQG